MPIYEYVCKKCQHTLDALQKMNDEPLLECPECGEPQLRRLISAPRFRLKGAGWYETDFKKDNQRNVHKSDDDAPKKDKADNKSEAKSEGKSESKSESTSTTSSEKSEKKDSKKDKDVSKPAAVTRKDKKADAG